MGRAQTVRRLSHRGQLGDSIRTRCKHCRESIRHGDEAVWIRRPLVGLVHTHCAAQALEAATSRD